MAWNAKDTNSDIRYEAMQTACKALPALPAPCGVIELARSIERYLAGDPPAWKDSPAGLAGLRALLLPGGREMAEDLPSVLDTMTVLNALTDALALLIGNDRRYQYKHTFPQFMLAFRNGLMQ